MQSDRYHTISNGIEVSACEVDEVLHERAKRHFGWCGRLVVGHVGRFVSQKNDRFLLKTFSVFHKRHPEAWLVLVGAGPLEKEVRRQVDELGLVDDVVFFGLTDDVPAVLSSFDLFVFPSVYEGLGVAIIEAQAAGIPALVSDAVPSQAFFDSLLLCVAAYGRSREVGRCHGKGSFGRR